MGVFEVKPAQMKKKLNPMNKWEALGTKAWKTQYGLIKAFDEDRPGRDMGNYYLNDKGHKNLWDLYVNGDGYCRSAIEKYYGFSPHLSIFLQWCFNDVAAAYAWKEDKANEEKDQMDFFPYEYLWNLYYTQVIKPYEESKPETQTA